MSFKKWLETANAADLIKLANSTEHFYFMSNAQAGDRGNTFIARDLSLFSTPTNNFFITNTKANKGIQCRFGMRGIIAEAHYDSGRNMVAMLKGSKRYILTPPRSCSKLGIISDINHPSYRHSVIDWSDLSQAKGSDFDAVEAIDTIVQTGEILYIPSYWFHYIVSLEYSIQCNSRSGSPPQGQGQAEIEKCMGIKLKTER
jgi:Cupin-like domain